MPEFITARQDSTIPTKDWKLKKFQPKQPGDDFILTDEPTPDLDARTSVLYENLQALGHEPAILDTMVTPSGQRPKDYRTNGYKIGSPLMPNLIESGLEAAKFSRILQEGGLMLDDQDVESLTGFLGKLAPGTVSGIAEAHKWWSNMRHQLADKSADFITGGALNLTLGMSLLDFIEVFDKQGLNLGEINGIPIGIPGKIHALTFPGPNKIPPEQRHSLENRILPTITLEGPQGPKEFNTGTSAAFWVISQKLWGLGERKFVGPAGEMLGDALAAGSKLVGNESLTELGEALNEASAQVTEQGEQRSEMAFGQVPPLVASLGTPSTEIGSGISWFDIVERRFGLEDEVDTLLARISKMNPGLGGALLMQLVAATGAADVVMTPSFWTAPAIGGLRKGASAAARSLPRGLEVTAEQATKVARTTYRLDDAIDAVTHTEQYLKDIEGRATTSMLEYKRTTGEPKMPAPMYRELMAAKRQANQAKEWLDNMKDVTEGEIMMRPMRRSPKLLPAPAETPKYSDSPDVMRELIKDREDIVRRGTSQVIDYEYDTIGELQQRAILGPDDTEYAGDAIEMMVKTGGLSIDDVTVAPVAPEYYTTPAAGPLQFLNWRNVRSIQTRAKTEERYLKQVAGILPGYEEQLKHSSKRMLVQQEDILLRNLGAARAAKDKNARQLYGNALKQVREQIAKIDTAKDLPGKFEDILSPGDPQTIMGNPGRFNRWLQLAGDRVIRGVYPGSLQISYWHSKLGQLHSIGREPQRFYEAVDPAAWDDLRNSMLRETQEQLAWNDMLLKELQKTGILKYKKKFDMTKHFHPYGIDVKKGEKLFDLLNTRTDAPAYEALLKAATPKEREVAAKIRTALDADANIGGVARTERYLEGYIRHHFDQASRKYGTRIMHMMGLSPNAEIFASHLMKRRGNEGYLKDVVAALEVYGRMARRKRILEPTLDRLLLRAQSYPNKNHRAYVHSLVRQLKGQPSYYSEWADRWIGGPINRFGGIPIRPKSGPFAEAFKELPSRIQWQPGAIDRSLMGLTSMFYMGLIGGNPSYPFMQVVTAIPTTSSRFGMGRTLGGITNLATREGQALANSAGVYQPFINLLESPRFKSLSKFTFEKIPAISPFGVMPNSRAEFLIRGVTQWAALDMYLNKFGFATWDEALQAGWGRRVLYESLRSSEEVNHMFGALGRHPASTQLLGHGGSMGATQFLSFNWKQTDELLSQTLRDPSKIMQYLAVSGWVSHVAARDLGIDATQYVGLGYAPTRVEDITSPAIDLMMAHLELSSALSMRDPSRVSRATEEVLKGYQNMLPAQVAWEKLGKAARKIATQEARSSTGEKLRDLDFAGKEGLGVFMPEEETMRGLGPEAIPTMFMQRGIKEAVFQRSVQANRQETERFHFNRKRAIDNYIDAVEAGNDKAERELYDKLQNVYRIRLSAPTAIERAQQARMISYWLRSLANDKATVDRVDEIIERFGIGDFLLPPASGEVPALLQEEGPGHNLNLQEP